MPGAVRKIPVRSVFGEEAGIEAFNEISVAEEDKGTEVEDPGPQVDCVEELHPAKFNDLDDADDNEDEFKGKRREDDAVESIDLGDEPENENRKDQPRKTSRSSRQSKASLSELFSVAPTQNHRASPLREEEDEENEEEDEEDVDDLSRRRMEEDLGEENASGEQQQSDTHKRKKWKSFTDGMKKYKAAMKKKLTRPKKDKNGVEEISIKPSRTLHSNEADECWAVEEPAPKAEKKSKKSKTSVTKAPEVNPRSGSAGSGSSGDACVVELTEVDDGIETIYDADQDEISS